MRKGLLVAAAALMAGLAPQMAVAGERENAMSHIAQAFAVTQLCSRLEIVQPTVALVAAIHGVDFDKDQQALLARIKDEMAPWRGQPKDAACAAGLLLYGKDGANVPGLVRIKAQ